MRIKIKKIVIGIKTENQPKCISRFRIFKKMLIKLFHLQSKLLKIKKIKIIKIIKIILFLSKKMNQIIFNYNKSNKLINPQLNKTHNNNSN